MDMFLVDVSGYDKLMFAAGKFQSQLLAQLVGLLRCNGSWFKGLDNQVGNHVFIRGTPASGGGGVDLFGNSKFLPGRFRGTLVASDQKSAVCFLRVPAVINTLRQHSGNTSPLAGMAGF